MKTQSMSYITCMCTSLRESSDQFVSACSMKRSRLENSLSNCENELVCKCYSDGKIKIENFNREGFLVRLKDNDCIKYVSCAFGLISNRRLVILARSDNKLIVLMEGLFENMNVFDQIEMITIPTTSSVTCLDVALSRRSNLLMNSVIVGCYDGSLHIFNLMIDSLQQLLISYQPFPNNEGCKAIGILKVTEDINQSYQIFGVDSYVSILYIARTDGELQICRLTTKRNAETSNATSVIENLKCISSNSCISAMSFCDLVISGEIVKVVAVTGVGYLSIYYSKDNFTTLGKISINNNRTVTSILALRLEREDRDLLSLLFGDDLGQLYRVKITDMNSPSINLESKNLLGAPQTSMVMQTVLVRRPDRNSILFTTRRDEIQEY